MSLITIKTINAEKKEFEQELSVLLNHGWQVINTGLQTVKEYNFLTDYYWAILKNITEQTAQEAIKT